MEDEIWTTRDGQKIAVGDMTEGHVRNTLRMILRKQRKQREQSVVDRMMDNYDAGISEMTIGDGQDELNARAYRDLANPEAFFPLLDGGVYGSSELQKKYGR